MKKLLISCVLFFLSLNINAEISQYGITDIRQLDDNEIIELISGNQLTGFISDGPYEGPIIRTFYKDGTYETTIEDKIYSGIWQVGNTRLCAKLHTASDFNCIYWYIGSKDGGTYAYIVNEGGQIVQQYHESISLVQLNQEKKKAELVAKEQADKEAAELATKEQVKSSAPGNALSEDYPTAKEQVRKILADDIPDEADEAIKMLELLLSDIISNGNRYLINFYEATIKSRIRDNEKRIQAVIAKEEVKETERAEKACWNSSNAFRDGVDMGSECAKIIKHIRANYQILDGFTCRLFKLNQIQELLPLDKILDNAEPGKEYGIKRSTAYIKKEISLRRESLQKFDQLIKEFGLDTNPLPCTVQLRVSYVKIIEENVDAYQRAEEEEKQQEKKEQAAEQAAKEAYKRHLENLKKTADLHYKSGLFKNFTDNELKKEEENGRSSRAGPNYQLWLNGNKHFASDDNEVKLTILGIMKQTTTIMQVVRFCEINNIRNNDFIQDMKEVKRIMNVFQMLIPVQIDKGILLSRIESHPVPDQLNVPMFREMYELGGSKNIKLQKLCRDQQKMMRAAKVAVAYMFNIKE